MWRGDEVETYERLKQKTTDLQKKIPQFIKEIVEKHL